MENKQEKKIYFKTSDGFDIGPCEKFYIVNQSDKECFVKKEFTPDPFFVSAVYGSDWSHIRFKEEASAIKYAELNNAKMFSLMEIHNLCVHSKISEEDIKKLLDYAEETIKFYQENK